jgi:hypothetical protein
VRQRLASLLVAAVWCSAGRGHHVRGRELGRRTLGNNPIETDQSQLKHGCGRCAACATNRTATVIIAGLAFIQNPRRGHYELGVDLPRTLRIIAAFDALAQAI